MTDDGLIGLKGFQDLADVAQTTAYRWSLKPTFPAPVTEQPRKWRRSEVQAWLDGPDRPPSKRVLTDERIAQLRQRYLETYNVSQCAREFGISRELVYYHFGDLIRGDAD